MVLSVYDNQYHPVDYYTDRVWPVLYWPTLGTEPVEPTGPQRETWTIGLTPATIVGAALVEDGMAGAYLAGEDWPLFISMMPSEPDNAVMIVDTSPVNERRVGMMPIRRYYGIQVLVRAEDAVSGRIKMNEIAEALQYYQNRDLTINGDDFRIKSAKFSTGIIHLPMVDSQRRHLFSLNLLSVVLGLEDVV